MSSDPEIKAARELAGDTPIAIDVRGVSKRFDMYAKPTDRLLQTLRSGTRNFFGKGSSNEHRQFLALRDISFQVRRGEAFGIIGRNGSGKSTLLQIISGTLEPTTGDVLVNGRVAALLELGAGFNPEFTGRENVRVCAALYGLTASQIDDRMDSILRFAGIGDFVDQPVKTFSSGMFVRLAFAVIAHCDADIMVIDEALSVGDVFFTQKCMRFIRDFLDGGGTLLFVSHDMNAVTNLCTRAAMLFPEGKHEAVLGEPKVLCKAYLGQVYDDPDRHRLLEEQRRSLEAEVPKINEETYLGELITPNLVTVAGFRSDAESFGNGGAAIVDAGFLDESGSSAKIIVGDSRVRLRIAIEVKDGIPNPAIGVMIKDRLGQYIYTEGTDMRFRGLGLAFQPDDVVEVEFAFRMPILIPGHYTLNLAIAEGIGHDHIQHHWIHDALHLESIGGPVVHGISGLSEFEPIIVKKRRSEPTP